jgi:hypothetical protein
LTLDRYLDVLDTGQSGSGVNVGFRASGRGIETYTQTRKSLSYFYIKRRVQADSVSTKPILI